MIQALLPSILPAVTDVIGRFLPEDKEARAKAERQLEQQLATHLAKIDVAQLEINKTEAAHRSIWVSLMWSRRYCILVWLKRDFLWTSLLWT